MRIKRQKDGSNFVKTTLCSRIWNTVWGISSMLLHLLAAPILSLIYIQGYIEIIKSWRENTFKWSIVFSLPAVLPDGTSERRCGLSLVIRIPFIVCPFWPSRLVHYALVPKLLFLRHQYSFYCYLSNYTLHLYWQPLGLAIDIVKFSLSHMRFTSIILIVTFLVVHDIVCTLTLGLWIVPWICFIRWRKCAGVISSNCDRI